MRRKSDGWNIVLAGLWNRAIFTPEWVNQLLFHEPEVETLLSIMPYLPIIYRNRQVAIEVSGARLVFRPRRLDDTSLRQAESMAHAVLDKLRDTPLLAVGLNFAFVEDNPTQTLVRLFNFGDNPQVVEAGWDLQERRIVRKIVQGGDTLNLALIFDGREVTIEFNYHTEATSNETAREAVRNRLIRLRDLSAELLERAYHLELAPEGNSDG
jgi:hypothetical protein